MTGEQTYRLKDKIRDYFAKNGLNHRYLVFAESVSGTIRIYPDRGAKVVRVQDYEEHVSWVISSKQGWALLKEDIESGTKETL